MQSFDVFTEFKKYLDANVPTLSQDKFQYLGSGGSAYVSINAARTHVIKFYIYNPSPDADAEAILIAQQDFEKEKTAMEKIEKDLGPFSMFFPKTIATLATKSAPPPKGLLKFLGADEPTNADAKAKKDAIATRRAFVIVQEYAGDSIASFASASVLDERVIQSVAAQLLLAMYVANTRTGLVHNDIKAENFVFLKSNDNMTIVFEIVRNDGSGTKDVFRLNVIKGDPLIRFIDLATAVFQDDVATATVAPVASAYWVHPQTYFEFEESEDYELADEGRFGSGAGNNQRRETSDIWSVGVFLSALYAHNRSKTYQIGSHPPLAYQITKGTDIGADTPRQIVLKQATFVQSVLGQAVTKSKWIDPAIITNADDTTQELTDIFNRAPEDFKLLLQDMLQWEPEKRAEFGLEGNNYAYRNALFHPYFFNSNIYVGKRPADDDSDAANIRLTYPDGHLPPLRLQTADQKTSKKPITSAAPATSATSGGAPAGTAPAPAPTDAGGASPGDAASSSPSDATTTAEEGAAAADDDTADEGDGTGSGSGGPAGGGGDASEVADKSVLSETDIKKLEGFKVPSSFYNVKAALIDLLETKLLFVTKSKTLRREFDNDQSKQVAGPLTKVLFGLHNLVNALTAEEKQWIAKYADALFPDLIVIDGISKMPKVAFLVYVNGPKGGRIYDPSALTDQMPAEFSDFLSDSLYGTIFKQVVAKQLITLDIIQHIFYAILLATFGQRSQEVVGVGGKKLTELSQLAAILKTKLDAIEAAFAVKGGIDLEPFTNLLEAAKADQLTAPSKIRSRNMMDIANVLEQIEHADEYKTSDGSRYDAVKIHSELIAPVLQVSDEARDISSYLKDGLGYFPSQSPEWNFKRQTKYLHVMSLVASYVHTQDEDMLDRIRSEWPAAEMNRPFQVVEV